MHTLKNVYSEICTASHCDSMLNSRSEGYGFDYNKCLSNVIMPRKLHILHCPVNTQVSYRYRHLPGLYRTCHIPLANTSLVPFQYLHANTYNLQANVFWPGTFWIPAHQYIHTLPVNIFWPDTLLLSAYRYLLLTG